MEFQRVRRPEGPQDWEAQRAVITDLYIAKDVELDDLMKIMKDEHFFKATKKQYKTYFTKWDLRKNLKAAEYDAILKKKRTREEEGKGSAFRLRGALVDDSKITRYEKRTKTGDEHGIADAVTPENLSCFTPSPVASGPNAPNADLRQSQSPYLLSNRIVSPSERSLLVPRSPVVSSPNVPNADLRQSQSPFSWSNWNVSPSAPSERNLLMPPPSPVASSPNVPNADLRQSQSPFSWSKWIVSPSEQSRSEPSLRSSSPESRDDEVRLDYPNFFRALVGPTMTWPPGALEELSDTLASINVNTATINGNTFRIPVKRSSTDEE